jgi:phospholipase/carboxylesterase
MVAWLLRVALVGVVAVGGCDTATKQPATAAAHDDTPAPKSEPSTPAPDDPPPVARYETAAGLEYAEVMLGGAQPDDTVPMIVAIHGLGDEPHSFSQLFSAFPEPARLVLPRGLDATEGGGWSWFPVRARDNDVDALAQGIRNAADAIVPAITEIAERRPTAGKPVVTGFSQGGMLSFAIAVSHPDLVSTAIPVGGWLPPPLWPSQKHPHQSPRIVALHGTADNAVAFEPTEQATAHLKKLGWAIELKGYDGVRHVITPEIRRDLFDHLADAIRGSAKK